MSKHQCEYCVWFSDLGNGLGNCEAPRVMKDYSCRKAKEKKERKEGNCISEKTGNNIAK